MMDETRKEFTDCTGQTAPASTAPVGQELPGIQDPEGRGGFSPVSEPQKAQDTETHEQGDDKGAELMQIHEEMCNRTSNMQATLINAMDLFKADLYSTLNEWQRSLYPQEYAPIAERYIELYRMVNVDSLFDGLITKSDDEPDNEKTQSAMKLKHMMTKFIARFERSLNGLSLYTYYPAEGDIYDDIRHVSEEEDPYERSVHGCVVPGIDRRTETGTDVIIPAVVTLSEITMSDQQAQNK